MAKVKIGENLYLFKKDATSFQDALLISSHGGIRKTDSADLSVAYGTLYFYTEHGKVLPDPGVRGIMQGSVGVVETVATGASTYDYALDKYQGHKHQGDMFAKKSKFYETYDTIESDVAYVDEFNALLAEAQSAGMNSGQAAMMSADVITVRNRKGSEKMQMTLGTLLGIVGKLHQYTHIHCSHCRSYY